MFLSPIQGGCALLLAVSPLLVSLPSAQRTAQQSRPTAKRPAPKGGAGLLVTCKRDGKAWLLLGHDRRGFWDILGGHTEWRQSLTKGRRLETPLETAARESFEESRMLLPYGQTIRKAKRLGTHGGYTIFTLQADYIPRASFREAFIPTAWKSYDEMDDYAWVELSSLIAEINLRDKAQKVRFAAMDPKRELHGLRPALFGPLKKLTKLWGILNKR